MLDDESISDAAIPDAALPDSASALGFLERWCPGGPWVLTAIRPDRKAVATATFSAATLGAASRWLDEYNGASNLYFHVNPTRGPLVKKAEREDVAALAWLHVDIDPRTGEDIEAERVRALGLLTTNLPAGVPPPTVIVFSGGGYQGFWKLAQPLALDGSLEQAEDAKLWNLALERAFGADHCHNIDRIMRLPGTVNLPDAKKQKKGRVPTLATLVEFNDRTIELDDFEKAEPTPEPTPPPTRPGALAQAGESAPPVTDLDAFQAQFAIHDRVMRIIALGNDRALSGAKDDDDSRSSWMLDAVCQMIRCGVPDGVIHAIITDPNHGVSAHVLDQGSPIRYAWSQVRRAHMFVSRDPQPRVELRSARVEAEIAQAGAPPPPREPEPPLVLDPKAPFSSAAAEFIQREARDLKHYNDDWLDFTGAAYAELEDATMRARVYAFLNSASARTFDKDRAPGPLVPFCPDETKVSKVIDALKARAHVPSKQFEPPCWLSGEGPPPHELIAMANGLLHLPSSVLRPATPALFTRNALEFGYDPSATSAPEWHKFLASLWPDQPDSIAVLQEMFGYLITPDTRLHKAFLLRGPARSGKGTIGRVLAALVGKQNMCAPSLTSLGKDFGLQPLIGKQLALVSDMRLGPKTDKAAVAENLLRITGEDNVDIGRKYKHAWTGRLATRFVIMTNPLPAFADASGALANRFIPIVFTKSFLGREDLGLLDRLLAELPAILNWAIEGWRRLRERGHFKMPTASSDLIRDLEDAASPVTAFVRDCCVLAPDAQEEKTKLYGFYRGWCERNGRPLHDSNVFGRDLLDAFSGKIDVSRPREGGERTPVYRGIRARDVKPY